MYYPVLLLQVPGAVMPARDYRGQGLLPLFDDSWPTDAVYDGVTDPASLLPVDLSCGGVSEILCKSPISS